MRPAVIAFDLDGTLVDTAPDLIGTLNWLLAESGYDPVEPDTVRPAIGFGARVMIERSLKAQGVDLDRDAVTGLHQTYLGYYAEHLADCSRAFPGVIEALESLAGRDCTLAVCTNKSETLSRLLLDKLGLSPHFRAVCGYDTFAVRKPDPGHLFGTIERAGGLAGRALMVGDSITDIDTARAARVPVVAVDFGYTEKPVDQLGPDAVISHYDQLVATIEALSPHLFEGAGAGAR